MGAGLPVVASDIPGNRQLVEHERQGLLTPPRDPAAWAASVDRLLASPQLATQLGNQGRLHVERHFTLHRSATAHLRLIEDITAAADRGVNHYASSANPADA